MQLLIVDTITPKPYTAWTLEHETLGGTEATVVRIAAVLDAVVMQHNRTEDEGRFVTPNAAIDPSHVIVLREASAALDTAARFPNARTWLWLHDLAGPDSDRGKRLAQHAAVLAAADITLVCVSDFHLQQVRANFLPLPPQQRPRVVRIYNPVVTFANCGAAPSHDPNKLVFFSSPHKGLPYALDVFAHLHRRNPALRLYIANPGYRSDSARTGPGVINLGSLTHRAILDQVASALCTFYPNYIYPETFGLALAESNSLGTPVLTHAIGAASEVLADDAQFVRVPPVRNLADSLYWRIPALRPVGERLIGMAGGFAAYETSIRDWQDGARPRVNGQARFDIDAVGLEWRSLLHGGEAEGQACQRCDTVKNSFPSNVI